MIPVASSPPSPIACPSLRAFSLSLHLHRCRSYAPMSSLLTSGRLTFPYVHHHPSYGINHHRNGQLPSGAPDPHFQGPAGRDHRMSPCKVAVKPAPKATSSLQTPLGLPLAETASGKCHVRSSGSSLLAAPTLGQLAGITSTELLSRVTYIGASPRLTFTPSHLQPRTQEPSVSGVSIVPVGTTHRGQRRAGIPVPNGCLFTKELQTSIHFLSGSIFPPLKSEFSAPFLTAY